VSWNASGDVRQQRWRGIVLKVCVDRLKNKVESRSALKCASTDDGPKTFIAFATFFAACALRDESIYDRETHRLFGKVVCGIASGCGNGYKVSFAVPAESIGYIERPSLQQQCSCRHILEPALSVAPIPTAA